MPKFQTPRGTRDFLPDEMIRRQHVFDTVRSVFEKWGFDPIETPAFEEWTLLSAKSGGGEAIKNEIYYFKDKSNRELGLRFDLTVPMARVVASNPGLPKPFRRYCIGRVWRYDRPGPGRYREFWQCDVDVAGAAVGEADALCIAAACNALKELGLDFSVRISSRKIVEGFVSSIGVKNDMIVDVLRSIDKLDKIGEKEVVNELKRTLDSEKIKKIMKFITIRNIADAGKAAGKSDLAKEGIAEIEKILVYAESFSIIDCIKFDLSLVRGLEYYTGPVFEITSEMFKSSIGGGGRYDNLIELFGGKPTPATGISLGIERIIDLMTEGKMLGLPKTMTKIYIAPISASALPDAIRMARELIDSGVPAEFDLMNRSISKQLDYANSRGIPFVIVLGEKEKASGKAKLRDMKTGAEKEIGINDAAEIKKLVL